MDTSIVWKALLISPWFWHCNLDKKLMLSGYCTQKITPLILWMDSWLHPTWLNADNDGNPGKISWGLASDHSGRPSDPSSRLLDPSSWPSDPIDRGWRDQLTEGRMDGRINGRTNGKNKSPSRTFRKQLTTLSSTPWFLLLPSCYYQINIF